MRHHQISLEWTDEVDSTGHQLDGFFALLIEGLAWGGLERFLPGVFVLVLVGPVLQGRVRLPRLVSATLAIAAVLFAVLRSRGGLEVEVVLADFSLHLLVLKCFDRRNPRDETQLMSLSALMVFAAALRDEPPLLMWLAMLIWARLAFSAVILRQTGRTKARATHDVWLGRPGPALATDSF